MMMSFGNFLLLVLIAYAIYYTLLLVVEYLSAKGPSSTGKPSNKIQFAVAPITPVQSLIKAKAESNQKDQSISQLAEADANEIEDSTDDYEQNEGENLFVDLGLETITDHTGIEVTEENLEKYFTTPQ